MRFRTSIITAIALLALVVPVAANAAATNASRAVNGGGTTANTRLVAKNRPVVIVGAAKLQALGACTTVMIEGYLLTTNCGNPAPQSEISSSSAPSTGNAAPTPSGNTTSQAPAAQVKSGCTTDLFDGYLLITYC
jgi:hypothetical protein